MNGEDRPWHVGVLWRQDRRIRDPVLEALRARGDLVVGDNQPYSGLGEFGFTIEFHAQRHAAAARDVRGPAGRDRHAREGPALRRHPGPGAGRTPGLARALHPLRQPTRNPWPGRLLMAPREPALTLGIEEEYLLVDLDTRELVTRQDPGFMRACQASSAIRSPTSCCSRRSRSAPPSAARSPTRGATSPGCGPRSRAWRSAPGWG